VVSGRLLHNLTCFCYKRPLSGKIYKQSRMLSLFRGENISEKDENGEK
jgi:hypothetical protein